MFLHGDPLHLIGNMVFLLVFGRKVENQLERLNFIALYFATGITAAMTHTLMEPDSSAPLIGASGAISGVLGAFFIYNPRARITSGPRPRSHLFPAAAYDPSARVDFPGYLVFPADFHGSKAAGLKRGVLGPCRGISGGSSGSGFGLAGISQKNY